MTTLNKISDQIREIYLRSYGTKARDRKVDRREIIELVIQEANRILSLAPVKTSAFRMEDFPSLMLATYTGVAVSAGEVTLPTKPINLPHDMGVWQVIPENGSYTKPYIPIPNSMWSLVADLDEADLEDQIGFRVVGSKIKFTKTINATTVTLQMFVLDPSKFATSDVLPITADMQSDIISVVLKKLGVPPRPEQEEEVKPVVENE